MPEGSGTGYYLDSGGASELAEVRARHEFEAALRESEALASEAHAHISLKTSDA